jgi:hypothetical protein
LSNVARKKTPERRVNVRASLSHRLREIRQELFGSHGRPELARRLNLPARTWYNHETGATVPAEILLTFIDQTRANPVWLLSGEGPKYQRGIDDLGVVELTPIELIRRGLEKLEQEPSAVVIEVPENVPGELKSDFVAVSVAPIDELGRESIDPALVKESIMAYRHWIPNPLATVGVRLTDDAMYPILPSGSVVAIDRSRRDIKALHGRMVAASPEGRPMIRWLELGGRHLILRPNQPSSDHRMLVIEINGHPPDLIIGEVVWSWSHFSH